MCLTLKLVPPPPIVETSMACHVSFSEFSFIRFVRLVRLHKLRLNKIPMMDLTKNQVRIVFFPPEDESRFQIRNAPAAKTKPKLKQRAAGTRAPTFKHKRTASCSSITSWKETASAEVHTPLPVHPRRRSRLSLEVCSDLDPYQPTYAVLRRIGTSEFHQHPEKILMTVEKAADGSGAAGTSLPGLSHTALPSARGSAHPSHLPSEDHQINKALHVHSLRQSACAREVEQYNCKRAPPSPRKSKSLKPYPRNASPLTYRLLQQLFCQKNKGASYVPATPVAAQPLMRCQSQGAETAAAHATITPAASRHTATISRPNTQNLCHSHDAESSAARAAAAGASAAHSRRRNDDIAAEVTAEAMQAILRTSDIIEHSSGCDSGDEATVSVVAIDDVPPRVRSQPPSTTSALLDSSSAACCAIEHHSDVKDFESKLMKPPTQELSEAAAIGSAPLIAPLAAPAQQLLDAEAVEVSFLINASTINQ